MMVQVLDSTPDLDAGSKIYEILKFDELQVFSVFNDVNDVSVGSVVEMKNLMILIQFVKC